MELEEKIATGKIDKDTLKNVVMIQCVGSREGERPYCSKICCSHALKNALKIKEINPQANVYILCREVRAYGFKEEFYSQARDKGIIFVRYSKENKPKVEKDNGKLRVSVFDPILQKGLVIEPSLVALSVAIVPNDVRELAKQLKTPLTKEGFFLEAHVKLRPVEAAVDGIFYAGIAHFPKPVDETISQALAAAAKATVVMAKGEVKVEPIVSSVDEQRCIGCGICEKLCPYKAIRIVKMGKKRKAETISASCKGCGVCSAHCPQQAIIMGRFTNEQIRAQIEAFGKEE